MSQAAGKVPVSAATLKSGYTYLDACVRGVSVGVSVSSAPRGLVTSFFECWDSDDSACREVCPGAVSPCSDGPSPPLPHPFNCFKHPALAVM